MTENPADIAVGRVIVLRDSLMMISISAVIILQYNLSIGTHKLRLRFFRWYCLARTGG